MLFLAAIVAQERGIVAFGGGPEVCNLVGL